MRARGSGPALLLIHGLGADHQDWLPVAARLESHFEVLLVDLPGQGASRGEPLPASIEALAGQLWDAIDRRGIESLAIAGHSLGGAVAQAMALARPERCQRLVICNSLTAFVPYTLRGFMELQVRRVLATLLGPVWTARLGARRMFPAPAQAEQRAMVIERGRRNTRRSYLHYLDVLTRWRGAPAELAMPVLWLASGANYFPNQRVRDEVAAIPDCELRFFDHAGHGLPMQHPDQVAAAIAAFLGGSSELTPENATAKAAADERR